LPLEQVTSPLDRCVSDSADTALTAPRTLKQPQRCQHSILR